MKVFVTNVVNGREFMGEFETEAERDAWVSEQIDKDSWGKKQYLELKDVQAHENPRAVLVREVVQSEPAFTEAFEPILDEDGHQTFVDVTKYEFRIPQEYEVTMDQTPVDKAPLFFEALRSSRTKVLRDTDWTQLADAPLTSEQRTHYREYRQYLRDLPLNYNNQSIADWNIMEFEEWKLFRGYGL